MKDRETKIHPLVKVGSALGAIALALGQAGCRVSPTPSPDTSTPGPRITETWTPTSTETATQTQTATPPATEAPTLTETPTSTEQPQAEPCTMVLDSEYNLGRKIEIIPENSKAFYNYLITALYNDNPLYFQAHPELGATANDFINYIKTHDSIPAGLKIPTAFLQNSSLRLTEIEHPLNLKNFDMMFINFEEYLVIKSNPPEWFDESKLLFASATNESDKVKLGYFITNENGTDELVLAVVETAKGVGFPEFDGTPPTDQSGLDLANAFLQGIVYITKGFRADSLNQLIDLIIPQGTILAQAGQNYYKYSNQTHTFNEMSGFIDIPALILSLKDKKLRVPLPPEVFQLPRK